MNAAVDNLQGMASIQSAGKVDIHSGERLASIIRGGQVGLNLKSIHTNCVVEGEEGIELTIDDAFSGARIFDLRNKKEMRSGDGPTLILNSPRISLKAMTKFEILKKTLEAKVLRRRQQS